MFLSIILKFQVPDIDILFGIRKKATAFDGPWPENVVLGPRVREAASKKRKNVIHSTRKRFARSTIPEEKWGTNRSLARR